MKQKTLFFLCLAFSIVPLYSQTIKLDLSQCIELATDSSLQAFQAKSGYLSGYWSYRSYKASRLPSLSLNVSPLSYSHSITQRYDYNEDIDIYRSQQSLSSSAGISVSQLISPIGGTLRASSNLNYYTNMGENDFSQFSTTPFSLSYSQSLFGFNSHKWDRKIEPLKYKQAKMQYLYEVESISEEVVGLFFDLALTQKEHEMAFANILTTDTLYQVGLEREKISAISQADIMTLELDLVDAKNTLKNVELNLKDTRFNLTSFLNMNYSEEIELQLPEIFPLFIVDKQSAIAYARENNPDYIENLKQLLETEKNIESSTKSNSVTVNISGGIGFNQAAATFREAYDNLSRQDNLSLSISIPVFDWGIRKGQLGLAKNNREITKLLIEQKEEKLRQEIISSIDNFHLQCELIRSAQKALDLSEGAYDNTKQRFIIGKSEVNNVTIALNRYKEAQRNYINILKQYWAAYYKIRRLTLYDFAKGEDLSSHFEENIKAYYYE